MSRVEIVFDSSGNDVEKTADRVAQRIANLGKASESASAKTAKGASLASDSYKALQKDLSGAKRTLESLSVGSDAFEQQAEEVGRLEDKLKAAKAEMREAVASGRQFDDVAMATQSAAGSLETLQQQLREATGELNRLEPGTREFEEQGRAVQKLSTEVDQAKASVTQFTASSSSIRTVGTSAATAANSVTALRTKLRDARQALEGLEPGTQEFREQASEVRKLSRSLKESETKLKQFTGEAESVRGVTGSIAKMEQELSEANAELRKLPLGTKEFRAQKQEVDRLARSLDQAQRGFQGAGGIGGRVRAAVGEFATSVAGFGSLAGGLIATANLLKGELERVQRQNAEALTAGRTREQSVAALLQNAGTDLTDQIVDAVERVAVPEGLNVDNVLAVASSVASAGITDAEQIAEIASFAVRSQAGDAARATPLAGAAIDLSNSLGISIREAFGVLFQTAGAARPEDIAQLGRSAVRATSALTQAGVEAEKAQELFAASTLLAGDSTGEQGVSIANDLTQAFRKIQLEGIPDTIKVAGEDVAITLPDAVKAQLDGDGLKNLTLEAALDLSRTSREFEQIFESALPNSQNRAFTAQIVGGGQVIDAKLAQAQEAIDLQSAESLANQRVVDVDARTRLLKAGGQIAAAIDASNQNQVKQIEGLISETTAKVREQVDLAGIDSVTGTFDSLAIGVGEVFGADRAGDEIKALRDRTRKLILSQAPENRSGRTQGDIDLLRQTGAILNELLELRNSARDGELTPAETTQRQTAIRRRLQELQRGRRPERAQAALQVEVRREGEANAQPVRQGQVVAVRASEVDVTNSVEAAVPDVQVNATAETPEPQVNVSQAAPIVEVPRSDVRVEQAPFEVPAAQVTVEPTPVVARVEPTQREETTEGVAVAAPAVASPETFTQVASREESSFEETPFNTPSESQIAEQELRRQEVEQQRVLSEEILTRLDSLVVTNQQGFDQLSVPRIQDVRAVSEGPVEAASPSEAIG